MQREAVLATLAEEPPPGDQLWARPDEALGPLGTDLNARQISVAFSSLDKAGSIALAGQRKGREPGLYALGARGSDRVNGWPDSTGMPAASRRERLGRPSATPRTAIAEPADAALLSEGSVLCQASWTTTRELDNNTEEEGMHKQALKGESPLLRTRGLRKEYGKDEGFVRAVDHVDLEVARGETLAIMGPSGCGKSTLLHLLGGLDRPSGGELWLNERRIDQLSERGLAALRRREVGFVFQAFHLIDELTAGENVELPALLAARSPRQARQRALELLERVGLADRAGHLPSALSGGQRQRVAIARALVNEPLVVLADEPTGNLDSAATRDALRLFDELHAAGQTLVIVTHDERVAATADRIVSMRDGALVDGTRLDGGTWGARGDLVALS
jgi:putative ABC transport system ATP-binding protein